MLAHRIVMGGIQLYVIKVLAARHIPDVNTLLQQCQRPV